MWLSFYFLFLSLSLSEKMKMEAWLSMGMSEWISPQRPLSFYAEEKFKGKEN